MKYLLISLLVATLSVQVQAESAKRESVEKLLELTDMDAMVENIYAQMDQVFAGMSQQMGVQPSEQAIFDDYTAKVTKAMKTEMSWQKMKGPVTDIYLKHFSEKEVADMLKFYESETGKSLVEKMPTVLSESMMMSQQLMQSFMPKLMELSEEFKTKLEASREAP